MKKPKILTEKIAERFLKDKDSVDLSEFTSIEDAAAQVLAKHKGELCLNKLESISVEAAISLAKVELVTGEFNFIQLDSLSLTPEVAAKLAEYRGDQLSFHCASVDLSTIQAFRPFEGQLWLGKLTQLNDEMAAELASRSGGAYLDGLTVYNADSGTCQLAQSLCKWNQNRSFFGSWLGLRGAREIAPEVMDIFAKFDGEKILASEEIVKQLQALRLASVKATIREASLRQPEEWQNARIVLSKPPLKPLKGRNAERTSAKDASWWLPKKVCSWFVQRLDDAHKTSVGGAGYGSGKSAYISPEAAMLLREKADAWLWLMESEVKAAKAQERVRINSLATLKAPKQFKDGKVFLPTPKKPLARSFCSKPDFNGEDYQSVLHYYNYLPKEHVCSIEDPNGYPAKAMSPEAADLYRGHRAFWEAKHAESKAQAKVATQVRKQEAENRVEKAAKTAGLSRKELDAKLERLSELVAQGNLKLVADMISGFGEPWLYEALLAGASITTEGDLKPGKVLKRFKEHDKTIFLLAVAFMPDHIDVDVSINRNSSIRVEVDRENLELFTEQVLSRIPNLEPRSVSFCEVKNLSPGTAKFLCKWSGEISLSLTGLSDDAALALAGHKGSLRLTGFRKLTDVAAEAFSKHTGFLLLNIKVLTEHQASLLAKNCGELVLLELRNPTAETITALAAHAGSCSIGLKSLSDEVAGALALFRGDLTLPCRQLSPSAAKSLAQKSGPLSLSSLESLDLEVAGYLSKLSGPLSIGRDWYGCETSSEAIEALVKTLSGGDLNFAPCKLADTTCEALADFAGDVSFIDYVYGNITEMTEKGALSLAKRKSLRVSRTKIPKAARKILEKHGSWTDQTWTRKY